MNIGGTEVGPGEPVYVIAEIGSNHDGSLERALDLIRLAAEADADCAKFQLFRADKLYPGTITDGALPDEWLPDLKACCHENGVEFLCSVFSLETLEAYMQCAPAAVKIASPEATDRALVRAASESGVPLIVSTGAMTAQQTRDLVLWIEQRTVNYAVLHCVSAYPAVPEELNLNVIHRLPARVVGFSDHTLSSVVVPSAAVAAGAHIIEKHFTYDRKAAGADHPFALEPDEFQTMVAAIRAVEMLMGDGFKRVQTSEDPTDRRT